MMCWKLEKKDPSIRNVRGKPGFINCCLSWCWRWEGGCSIFSQYINTSVTQPQGEHNGGGFSRPPELIFLDLRKANDCFCVNANLLFPHWPELISSGICKDK